MMQRLATISTHHTYLVRRIAELRAKVRRGHFLAIGRYRLDKSLATLVFFLGVRV